MKYKNLTESIIHLIDSIFLPPKDKCPICGKEVPYEECAILRKGESLHGKCFEEKSLDEIDLLILKKHINYDNKIN